jgi:hypothetical protein
VRLVKRTLDIELMQQIFRPGSEIAGHVHLVAEKNLRIKEFIVSLQGEETVGANSINRSIIIPLVDEQKAFITGEAESEAPHPSEGNQALSCDEHDRFCFPLVFKLPENSPPSYASEIFKCLYFIKARLVVPWARDIIQKMHITIIPYETISREGKPASLALEESNIKAKVDLEKDSLLAGDALSGSFYMEHIPEEAPQLVKFELRAEERSLEESYDFSRTVWSINKEIPLKDVETGYTMAHFEFPTPADAPFTFRWNSFEVLWEFSVTITTFHDKELKIVQPILVKRII